MQSFIEIGQPIKEEMGVNIDTYAMDTLPSLQSDIQISISNSQNQHIDMVYHFKKNWKRKK